MLGILAAHAYHQTEKEERQAGVSCPAQYHSYSCNLFSMCIQLYTIQKRVGSVFFRG